MGYTAVIKYLRIGISLGGIVFLISCSEKVHFKLLPASHTNIEFNNVISESDSLNPLNQINIYNGGGVGIGDFNNDGLQDVYFTGNMVANQLYLNQGDFRFLDVTNISKVAGEGKWCRGVSVVDINADGKQDIYISASVDDDAEKRKNLLYVNQGNDKEGVPVFKELSREYGLDDSTHSTMALFFDYDKDGDLDVYLVVNEHLSEDNPSRFRPIITNGSHPSTGRLYRNDWKEELQHGVYINVSTEAGVITEGYGHAGIITDINEDGWPDIYVTNDFLSNNLLYINNHNGTFTDRSKGYFKQTSTFAMGVDVQDINNDGMLDVVELDMNPQDNYRKKMMLGSNSYQTMQNFDRHNYQYQYSKNTLQLNQGYRVAENDSLGTPVFSQISFMSGMSETDWSWTPLVTDFDDDGNRDIIITNGYPRDVTDHDFMVYRNKAALIATWEDIIRQIPQVKLHNYAYQNNGDLRFRDATAEWGLSTASFSNGAAYADLDNDGDMDLVVNNINDPAFVYENQSIGSGKKGGHYLNVVFAGGSRNPSGFGARISIYYDSARQQVYEHSPYRGYLSSVQDMAHFGLGKVGKIDSLVVLWPNGNQQRLFNVEVNKKITLKESDAKEKHAYHTKAVVNQSLFREVTTAKGMDILHREKDFVDFNIQKLLPHKFSAYSPALAVADVNGDGLDDLVSGGNSDHPAKIFYQEKNGRFNNKEIYAVVPIDESIAALSYRLRQQKSFQDEGILLFDADSDGDNDMYISRGGYEQEPGTATYHDRFYVNDGTGNFALDTNAIPRISGSKFCVRAADFDRDGDLDLFVSGRVEPWHFPKPVSSFLLRNDTEGSTIKFTDVTRELANDLVNIGLVCDGVFSDFDNDGWPDLVLAGEWMPVTFLKNKNGKFSSVNNATGIDQQLGWWNSIAPGDFDNDGDIDYIIGNLGLNSFFKASDQYPVYVTAADFDENGSYDAFPSVFLPASHQDSTRKEFPINQRDDVIKQMISMRRKFLTYSQYARSTMDSILSKEERKKSLKVKANMLASVYLSNKGNGKFELTPLPVQAQVSVINGMVVDDFDGDGNLDVVINGNDYGTDVSVGRYDALNGLLLRGDGSGKFQSQTIAQSGIFIPGNGKAMVKMRGSEGKMLLAASQNNGPYKIFELKKGTRNLPVQPNDVHVLVRYTNGKLQRRELYYGYSFLSQGTRHICIDEQVVSVEAIDNKGVKRNIYSK